MDPISPKIEEYLKIRVVSKLRRNYLSNKNKTKTY